MPSPKNSTLPKSYYHKGRELLAAALRIADPDLRREGVQAALKYYDADMGQDTKMVITVVSLYLLVVGTMIVAFLELPFWKAAGVVVCAYTFMSLLIGVVMRSRGYISESSLMGIWKQGFKVLSTLAKSTKE
jgi:hypothetical protein